MTDQNKNFARAADALNSAKRLVLKVGSALLMQARTGELNKDWMAALAADIARAHKNGKQIVLVSSGAIALGRGTLGLPDGALTLEQSQAAAAMGQIALAHAWQGLLQSHELKAAQILLTLEDTEQRRRYLNARSTINTLLDLGAVPIINENDTVATQEIRYGDNDRLAARVASMISADGLVLFSDVDGLYTSPEKVGDIEAHIPVIETLNDEIAAMAGESSSQYSRGGMITKLEAARITTGAGGFMVLANGKGEGLLSALQTGATMCSLFTSTATPRAARKNWIAGSLNAHNLLRIDAGAVKALLDGKSLLPIGVTDVSGVFERGDGVIVYAPDGTEVARGLVEYGNTHVENYKGHKTSYIQDKLTYAGRTELIHRDNLVLTHQNKSEK